MVWGAVPYNGKMDEVDISEKADPKHYPQMLKTVFLPVVDSPYYLSTGFHIRTGQHFIRLDKRLNVQEYTKSILLTNFIDLNIIVNV